MNVAIVIIVLVILLITSIVLLVSSIRKNLQYIEQIEDINDQITRSLDILDVCYKRVASKAQLEIMLDEPVIRDVVDDIKTSRDSILLVANLIASPFSADEEGNE